MLKINLISDLHLEFADLILPGGDILILAGDACEVKNINPEDYNPNHPMRGGLRRPDRFARFFAEELPKYQRVLYVLGNHEHYGGVYEDTHDVVKSLMPNNVTVLENQTAELEGVLFLGATLWTDLNRNDPLTGWYLRRNMNDFRMIRSTANNGDHWKLAPEQTHQTHKSTLEWMHQTLVAAGDKPCVVITHHSPSHLSIHPRFAGDYHMNGGFHSNLDPFIMDHPQIRTWCHGHTHDFFDYEIEGTRVLCNPRGYVGYESRTKEFDPSFGFEI